MDYVVGVMDQIARKGVRERVIYRDDRHIKYLEDKLSFFLSFCNTKLT